MGALQRAPWRPARALTRREIAVDAGVALVVFGASVGMLAAWGGNGSRHLDGLGVALAALASLPLVARRLAPLSVFAFTTVASATLYGLGYPTGPPLGPTVALFTVVVSLDGSRRRTRGTAAVVLVLFAAHVAAAGIPQDAFPVVALLAGMVVWGGAWVLGNTVRTRRERIPALEERALRAERDAERERRLAAAEERTRIARDLHDSAGHAINVILVQAGAARLLRDRDPERARAALETIEEVARDTIGEIDRLVQGLRENGASGGPDGTVEPPPGLAALEGLAERHRGAGLDVRLDLRRSRSPLPAGADQASYRILQEALTNAARHGAGSADVEVVAGPDALELAVVNPVAPDRVVRRNGGHGLVGMRERAALLGGSVDASAADGVFRIRARLPYGASGRAG